jgi:hypothetical protein
MATKNPLERPRSLGQVLSFATGATVAMCQDMLAEHDLTLAQWVILSALWRQDGMLISEIAITAATTRRPPHASSTGWRRAAW